MGRFYPETTSDEEDRVVAILIKSRCGYSLDAVAFAAEQGMDFSEVTPESVDAWYTIMRAAPDLVPNTLKQQLATSIALGRWFPIYRAVLGEQQREWTRLREQEAALRRENQRKLQEAHEARMAETKTVKRCQLCGNRATANGFCTTCMRSR